MKKPEMPPCYLLIAAGVSWLLCGWGLVAEEPVLGSVYWFAGVVVTGFAAGWYAKGRR